MTAATENASAGGGWRRLAVLLLAIAAVGLPVNGFAGYALLLAAAVVLVSGEVSARGRAWAAAAAIVTVAVAVQFLWAPPRIEEGHNVFLPDAPPLQRGLPADVYRQMAQEFDALYPGKFQNKTNGITPRRWLLKSNPRLAALITAKLGDAGWPRELDKLQNLERFASDAAFQREFMSIKRANKVDLAAIIKEQCGVDVSADALFDVQIKRLHEYKRQHLNLLHILALYRRLLQNPSLDIVPRVFVFAAKAAPGYDLAKNIIRAINVIGTRINGDTRIGGKIKVAFLPNYRVSLAERIIPAADLSERSRPRARRRRARAT